MGWHIDKIRTGAGQGEKLLPVFLRIGAKRTPQAILHGLFIARMGKLGFGKGSHTATSGYCKRAVSSRAQPDLSARPLISAQPGSFRSLATMESLCMKSSLRTTLCETSTTSSFFSTVSG